MANRPIRGSDHTLSSAADIAPGDAADRSAVESGPRRTRGSQRAAAEDLELGPCLEPAAISAALAGALDPAARQSVFEHLVQCPSCVERLAAGGRSLLGGGKLAPGELVARRYHIIRFVAGGGMGEVYEAFDSELNVRVALKAVAASDERSPLAVRALSREVLLARSIAHPNVCRIYDLGLHETGAGAPALRFLTMEFVDGMRLSDLVNAGPLPLAEAAALGRQLLLGLSAAHRAGVLHRDFKSDNVMLRAGPSGARQAVIMDFGLARSLESADAWWNSGNHRIEGSLLYMAPEQLMAQPLGWQTDIFAFGVVLFEMLTGTSPFAAQITLAAALRRCQEPPPRPSRLRPELSPALDRLVAGCLAPEREERYPDADSLLSALERAFGMAPTEPLRERLPVAAAVAALVALGLFSADAARHALTPKAAVSSAPPPRLAAPPPAPAPAQPAPTGSGVAATVTRDDVTARDAAPLPRNPPAARSAPAPAVSAKAAARAPAATRAAPTPAAPVAPAPAVTTAAVANSSVASVASLQASPAVERPPADPELPPGARVDPRDRLLDPFATPASSDE